MKEAPELESVIKGGLVAKRRTGLRRVLRVVLFLAIAVGVLAGGLFVYAQQKLRSRAQDIAELTAAIPDQPINFLVLGSDTREGLTEEEKQTFGTIRGRRADTIILVHIDEMRQEAVIIHFPRDLRVRLPGGGLGKINAAYGQGPGSLVDTVEEFTGLPVHHYVEMNFIGFRNLVGELGGVKVFFEKPLKDADSGLNVPKGCVELDGDQALAFVRVRKIDSDFERIKRQQLFVKLMMEKLTSGSVLLNPVKVFGLVNAFADNVTTDTALSVGDMKNIALRLRRFEPSHVDMRVVPSSGRSIGGVSYVIHHESEAKALFDAIRDRQPLPDYGRTGVVPIDPADVHVTVLNGTSVDGLAAKATDELRAKGFDVVAVGDAARKPYRSTVVLYTEGNNEKAKAVAEGYGAKTEPLKGREATATEVVLVLGENYAEGTATPPPPAASPSPSKPLVHECAG